jgi:hypothetical protein
MKYTVFFLLLVSTLLSSAAELRAQERKILSPRDSVMLRLDTNFISINYGRPSIRGRVIMGGLVPWNEVWRTGANEATHLRTNFDMTLGGVPVTRGRYTLWTIPSKDHWTVIINKQTGQWGTRYDDKQDLARFSVTPEVLPSTVDTFTMTLRPAGATSGVLALRWEKTGISIPFEKNDRIRPLSPPDSTEGSLNGKNVFIKYSRPYIRGRAIWGTVVPVDSVWRTGANLATSLTTEADLLIGTTDVPRGSYSLYSILKEQALVLIVSKKPGGVQSQYDPNADLARIELKREDVTAPVDPFRIWFEPASGTSVVLHLGWADRMYSAPVKLK